MVIGVILAAAINLWGQSHYCKRLIANGNKDVPEARLLPMMSGSTFFAAGLFTIGWTSNASVQRIG